MDERLEISGISTGAIRERTQPLKIELTTLKLSLTITIGLDWNPIEAIGFHRQQKKSDLRDTARFRMLTVGDEFWMELPI